MVPIPSNLPQHEWQKLYLAAMTEIDRTKIMEKLDKAEAAIFDRLQTLCTSPNAGEERTALDDAVCGLRVLKRDTLKFPDWN